MLKRQYRNIRGMFLHPEAIERLLFRIGKTEEECVKFFGEALWTCPGFAGHWLESTAIQKEWCQTKHAGVEEEGA